jgi:alkanesulfonate monooxygenase SsuD/methylene tetrahydromethanopterin reductase-like flavin-dependent oxidoreductase (luciferase family)
MRFAAKWAEVIFTAQRELKDIVAFDKQLRGMVVQAGRRPDSVKLLPGLSVIVAETDAQARSVSDELLELIDFDRVRVKLSKKLGGVDLSGLALDEPIPAELLAGQTIEGGASRYAIYRHLALEERKTLRELLKIDFASDGHWTLVGTPEQVADELQVRFEQGGCDGFVILTGYVPEGFVTFAEQVVPELRKRGIFREDYQSGTLRGHLGLERPARR